MVGVSLKPVTILVFDQQSTRWRWPEIKLVTVKKQDGDGRKPKCDGLEVYSPPTIGGHHSNHTHFLETAYGCCPEGEVLDDDV